MTPDPMRDALVWIKGECPNGCGETLFIGNGGYVTCSLLGCPAPMAAHQALAAADNDQTVRVPRVDLALICREDVYLAGPAVISRDVELAQLRLRAALAASRTPDTETPT